jgi:hypothetical protein
MASTATSSGKTALWNSKRDVASPWLPSKPGQQPLGHLWRWELEPVDEAHTRVTHIFDWSALTDEQRIPRARATTDDKLRASLDRLAELAER